MWDETTSRDKSIKIGWWVAIVLTIILLYRRLQIDFGYAVVAMVAALLFLIAFAADNGARIYPQGLMMILAAILVVAILFLLFTQLGGSYLVLAIVAIFLLIVAAVLVDTEVAHYSAIMVYVLATILAITQLLCYQDKLGYFEFFCAIFFQVVAGMLAMRHLTQEALLVIAFSGLVIGSSSMWVA